MADNAKSGAVGYDATPPDVRMKYAGAIGLICELSPHTMSDCAGEEKQERRDQLEQAVGDWCRLTGWSYRWILDRIEVSPP